MCGNHPSNKGGMTTVINQIMDNKWDKEGVRLSFVPTYMPGGKAKTMIFFLFAYIKVFFIFVLRKPDVFYTHMSVRGSFSRTKALHKLCKNFHVKDVIHLHGSEFKDWYKSVSPKKRHEIRSLIEECHTFIVLGKKWERFVSKIAPNAKIQILHNAVKIPKESNKWNEEETVFLFLGVLIPRKGCTDLLKAVKLLRDHNRIGNARFIIAGTGEEEEKLKDFTNQNDLNKHVRFLGWIEGKQKEIELKKAGVFVLPSYNEGLPVSILEAMSYGIPVISTKVGDIADAVKENKNGYLINPGDINSLADRIEKIMDKPRWEMMASNAKKYAMERFDISLFYNELLRTWKRV